MTDQPKAPGLAWRQRKGRRVAYWIAPKDAREKGYTPPTVPLSDETPELIVARCLSPPKR
jgi:hypothetical protein